MQPQVPEVVPEEDEEEMVVVPVGRGKKWELERRAMPRERLFPPALLCRNIPAAASVPSNGEGGVGRRGGELLSSLTHSLTVSVFPLCRL